MRGRGSPKAQPLGVPGRAVGAGIDAHGRDGPRDGAQPRAAAVRRFPLAAPWAAYTSARARGPVGPRPRSRPSR